MTVKTLTLKDFVVLTAVGSLAKSIDPNLTAEISKKLEPFLDQAEDFSLKLIVGAITNDEGFTNEVRDTILAVLDETLSG